MDRAKTTTLTGAEIVVRCLQEEGVEYVFGYPGGAVLFIYDELFKQDKVKHVLVRHEQGAVHAADGYSRSSKKVGVVTSAATHVGGGTVLLASIRWGAGKRLLDAREGRDLAPIGSSD